ncbi:MAG: efflux RND transporter periplasmic adaptor subunit [Verrucomicrobia bacterium]|nr:efflux RND transporter periplasmic adaptor subunit [Verrucomicrobiota bacterium]
MLPKKKEDAGFSTPVEGSPMDIPRIGYKKKKWRRNVLLFLAVGVGVISIGIFISRLEPALPEVDRGSVWIDTVTSGPLIRDVRGIGTLVPEDVRWVPARTDARVEQIVIWPGTEVKEDSVILTLSSAELEQDARDSDAAIKSSQAKLTQLQSELEGELLERQAALTKALADRDTAAAELEADQRLAKGGLISSLDFKKAQIAATELAANFEVERQRYEFAKKSMAPRLAVAQTELDQARAQADLHHSQVDALRVSAGMNGVLQEIAVDVGQQVAAGTNLARVADNTKLKAQIKIPETQARDIAVGQTAQIDMRNGSIVTGTVSRIDPAVREGTVLVDVTFHGRELPKGARPDLSVEGTIELERLADAVYVGRPAFGQDDSTIGLFRLSADGAMATRTKVRIGHGSATKVVIEGGLNPGDRVILSDTSSFDSHERIQLR